MPPGAVPEPASTNSQLPLRWRRESPDGDRLVTETEEFLCGRVEDLYRLGQSPLPGWVEPDWLAHGRPMLITERVEGGQHRDAPYGSWAWAVGSLAETVVQETDGNFDLIEMVQHHCIVPMELALLGLGNAMCLPSHIVTFGVPRIYLRTRAMRGSTGR